MTAPTWADRHARFYRTPLGQRVLAAEVGLLLGMLPESGTVASLGCGVGAHEAEVARRRPGLRVVGLDPDPGMLRAAPAHLQRVLGDASALPVRDGALDAVVFVTSLEFMDRPGLALAGAACALRAGGVAVALSLNPGSEWGRARLGSRVPQWSTAEGLGRALADALGGQYRSMHAMRVEGDRAWPEADPQEAVLLVAWATKG